MKENKQRDKNSIFANLIIMGILIVVISMIVIPIFWGTICYKQAITTHEKEIESYSTDTYDYLLQSVSRIFREDEQIIDINAKPDDIIIEKLEIKDDGKFICELYLDNGGEKKYFPNPNITAELSSDFDILYTSSPYASEEEFVKAFKTNIKDYAGEEAFKAVIIYDFGIVMLLLVPWGIITIIKSYKRNFHNKK